jgi:uncharacterized damage-inducible protein DinB
MNVEDIRTLYDYNSWANRRAVEACAALAPEQFTRDLGSSFRSVCDTLVHILGAEWVWLERWHGRSPSGLPGAAELSTLAAVAERMEALDRDLQTYVVGLTPQDLAKIIEYKTFAGAPSAERHWQMLQHLVNHGSYHRGQITTMLRQLGAKPLATDLIAFYRQQSKPASAR